MNESKACRRVGLKSPAIRKQVSKIIPATENLSSSAGNPDLNFHQLTPVTTNSCSSLNGKNLSSKLSGLDESDKPPQSTGEELVKLRQEVKEMIELTECLEKHREDELKFKQLTEVWKNGGLEAARMLAEKLVPTQSVRDLLVKFGIPTKMFLED